MLTENMINGLKTGIMAVSIVGSIAASYLATKELDMKIGHKVAEALKTIEKGS